jgi:dihydrofolate reductase
MLTLIAARDRNGAIGKQGAIPWHVPEDLRFFQRETLGGALVMGRRTWESLPVKPLKNRLNILVSRDPRLAEHVVGSTEEGVALAHALGYLRVYGIGGAGVYAALLPLADRLLLTEVDLAVEDADTHFPDLGQKWRRVRETVLRQEGPRCVAAEYLASR